MVEQTEKCEITVLYSQPIIACKRASGGGIENGQGVLVIANVSKRTIKVEFERYNRIGSPMAQGSLTIEPRTIDDTNSLVGGDYNNIHMYYKIWFKGSPKDIRASFIMQTVEGDPGSEVFTPLYAVSFS